MIDQGLNQGATQRAHQRDDTVELGVFEDLYALDWVCICMCFCEGAMARAAARQAMINSQIAEKRCLLFCLFDIQLIDTQLTITV